jgi:hypothetical protein
VAASAANGGDSSHINISSSQLMAAAKRNGVKAKARPESGNGGNHEESQPKE